ncbi:MAG: hypothetical protein SNF33_05455 [Candidatus Algichlamydia australiensis]|nr:hypothetical protein [Chlamydiales bacterium]
MKSFLALVLAMPLLFCSQKGVELKFHEGGNHKYQFSGYIPATTFSSEPGKRVKVEGKIDLQIDEVLDDGSANLTATLSNFKVDTETELGDQLVNTVLESMVTGGSALWTLSPKGELLEFTSDSFFFSEYANQIIALGLFSPMLRGAVEQGHSSLAHNKSLSQFEIEYAAEEVSDNGMLISFHINSSRIIEGKASEVAAFLRANFDLSNGWARETYFDIHCEQMGKKNWERNHYTFIINKCD